MTKVTHDSVRPETREASSLHTRRLMGRLMIGCAIFSALYGVHLTVAANPDAWSVISKFSSVAGPLLVPFVAWGGWAALLSGLATGPTVGSWKEHWISVLYLSIINAFSATGISSIGTRIPITDYPGSAMTFVFLHGPILLIGSIIGFALVGRSRKSTKEART